MMRRSGAAAGAVGAGVALLLGSVLAGIAGLVIAALVLSCCALIAVRVRLGVCASVPRPPRGSTDAGDPYQVYRDIHFRLGYRDGGHYGTAVRPMLRRLAAAALAERRRIDLDRNPDAARAALGEAGWGLLDPSGSVSREGPSLAQIESLAARLEEL